MRNTWKVARWEIKRNLKNKTYIIGLLSSPVLFLLFMYLGSLFGGSGGSEDTELTNVFVNDQLHVFAEIEETVTQNDLPWEMHFTDVTESQAMEEVEEREDTAYLFIDERTVNEGVVTVYTSEEMDPFFTNQLQVLAPHIHSVQMEKQLDLSEQELGVILRGVSFAVQMAGEDPEESGDLPGEEAEAADGGFGIDMERLIPGVFAGFIMISIVFTGMAIFQSASQEKKDKLAEIILSSLTPAELMQGKIVGYFVLGIIQSVVTLVVILPYFIWRFDLPIVEYLFVPELLVLLFIAVLGFLLFAAIFVGIGATMEDISTAGNFQGMVMMLPFLPGIFVFPVISDPSGLMAQIGTFIPFTSPGVLIMRLAMLEEWPWIEIIIALAILIISVWLFMKLAGKIFKVGILLYGKNSTPGEIWKWLRA